jgi:hypothetical protein
MKITGYKLTKTLEIGTEFPELKNSNNSLILFLRGFPELEKEFFSGNTITLRPSTEHFDFLENEISIRLKKLSNNWKEEFNNERIELLKKGNRIINLSFLNSNYEINTFGDQENQIIVNLISFYNLLKDTSEVFGLTISPEIEL